MTTFERVHPFRVPLPGGEHVRFASLAVAAGSAVEHQSVVIDERCSDPGPNGWVYDLAECQRIHAARLVG